MNWKLLLGVVAILWVYCLLGGVAFHFLEEGNEDVTRINLKDQVEQFVANHSCLSEAELLQLIGHVLLAYQNGVQVGNDSASATNWDYQSAIFFAVTVVTTIGYGNISPSTVGGKMFCVFYALVGIPLFLVATAALGDAMHRGAKKLHSKIASVEPSGHAKTMKSLRTLIVIAMGVVLFMLIPAGIFTAMEDWSYGDAMYYSYITLTTIGFGDFVPGTDNDSWRGWYRLCVSCWILIGLSWMAAVISAAQDIFSANIQKVEEKVNDATRNKQDNGEVVGGVDAEGDADGKDESKVAFEAKSAVVTEMANL